MVMGERMMYKVPEDCHIAFGKSEVDFYVWDPFKDDGQFQVGFAIYGEWLSFSYYGA